MLENIYLNYKEKYKTKIVFVKSGSFYATFDSDALIMNYLTSYNIYKNRVGFPKEKMNFVKDILKKYKIEYIFFTNGYVADKYTTDNNKYRNYLTVACDINDKRVLKNKLIKKIRTLISDENNYVKIKAFIDEF